MITLTKDNSIFQPRDAWDKLSMEEQAAMMKVAVRNGIFDLGTIRQKYNEFAEGGDTSDEEELKAASLNEARKMGALVGVAPFVRQKNYIGGTKQEARNKYWQTDQEMYMLTDSVARTYGINPDLLRYRLDTEGYTDARVKEINQDYRNNTNKTLLGEKLFNSDAMPYVAGDEFGLDDTATYINNGDVQLINENWGDGEFLNEKNRWTNMAIGHKYSDNFGIMAATLKYFRNLAKQDFPYASDADLDRYAAAYYNRGRKGGKDWVKHGAKGYTIKELGGPLVEAAMNEYKHGGGIYIKPSHRGRLTELKKRTGKSEAELYNDGNPAHKKMVVFARNSRKWKHGDGGKLFSGEEEGSQKMSIQKTPNIDLAVSNPWLFNKLNPSSYVSPEEQAVKRANRVFSNYDEAKDSPLSTIGTAVRNYIRYKYEQGAIPRSSGVSNCTLTVSQWVDPNNPLKNASSIYNTPEKYNYTPINAEDAVPGNVVVARNPDNGTFHTMMIEKFADHDGIYNFDGIDYPYKKGDPLMVYSRGGHHTDAIRRGIPLHVYTDNSEGKTENRFYRYNYPNEVFLPEIIIKPTKK